MTLARLDRRSVLCVHIISGVSRPLLLSIAIVRSPVLESTTRRTNSVFASFFYLRDVQHEFNDIRSLGPSVAAGERVS